jgi:hypothetical protein
MSIEINFQKGRNYDCHELCNIMKISEQFVKTRIKEDYLFDHLLTLLSILKFIRYIHKSFSKKKLPERIEESLRKRPIKYLLGPIKEKLPLIQKVATTMNCSQSDRDVFNQIYKETEYLTNDLLEILTLEQF